MNYSKKHIKRIAYKDYLINESGKYSFKGFKKWYAQTAFDIAETAHFDICFRNQKKYITNIDDFDKTIDNCLTPEDIEHACDNFDIEDGLKCISVFVIYEE